MKANYKKLTFKYLLVFDQANFKFLKMTMFISPYSKQVISGQGFGNLLNKAKPRNGKVIFTLTADIPKSDIKIDDIEKKIRKRKPKNNSSDESSTNGLGEIYNIVTGEKTKRKIPGEDLNLISVKPKNNIDDWDYSSMSGNGFSKNKKGPIDNGIVSAIIGKVKSGKGFYNI